MLVLWVWLLVLVALQLRVGMGSAKDASDYLAAAQVLHRGGNPYHWQAIWEGKRALLHLSEHTHHKELARVAEPPVLFWAMEPLIGLPFALVCLIYEVVFALCAVVGLTAMAYAFGWSRPVIPVLIGLALPPVSYYVDITNLGIFVFAGLGVGFLLCRRYPLLSGMVLSVAICKPQLAVPIAGLVLLFHSSSRIRSIAGFVVGAAAILAAGLVTTGATTMLWWIHAFHSFSDTLKIQTMYASLNVLYEPYLPTHTSMVIAAVLVVLALAATLLALRHYWHEESVPVRPLIWLWLLWFAVSPYDHYYDYVFLAPVVLALVADTRPGDRARALLILYAVSVAGFLEIISSANLVSPVLLLIVVAASLLPWPLRRARAEDRAAPAPSYQTSA
jgi:hypothetical protein